MNQSNLKLSLIAALLVGAVGCGACSSASTNTVSTGNTNAAQIANTANTANANKSNVAAPGNANAATTNATSEVKPPVKKEDMLAADTTAATTAAEKTGVPECDEYIAKYEACLNRKVPEAQRAAFAAPLEEMKKNWKSADDPRAKSALAGGCKQALVAAKQSMGAFSCDW